jgi:hypothetical protein
MAFGSTPVDSNNIPLSCGYLPGTGLKAIRLGKILTDASSNDSGPVLAEMAGSSKATYTYAISATAPYATPTDWVTIRGSATKLVKIVQVVFSGVATAATTIVFTFRVHTTANTAGTSTNPAAIQHDSADPAATGLVLLYTVAPTISGSPGPLLETVHYDLAIPQAASAILTDRYIRDFGVGPYQPIVLRGVAQEFSINFAAAAIPTGGLYDYSVTWTEE